MQTYKQTDIWNPFKHAALFDNVDNQSRVMNKVWDLGGKSASQSRQSLHNIFKHFPKRLLRASVSALWIIVKAFHANVDEDFRVDTNDTTLEISFLFLAKMNPWLW